MSNLEKGLASAAVVGGAFLVLTFVLGLWALDGPIATYQSLLAGIGAIAAAAVTISLLRQQNASIRQQIALAQQAADRATRTAELARRVSIAQANRPLIEILDRFAYEVCGEAKEAVAQLPLDMTPFDRGGLRRFARTLGSELSIITVLEETHRQTVAMMRSARLLSEEAERRYGPTTFQTARQKRSDTDAAIDRLATLAQMVARRLSIGWSVLELAGLKTVEELFDSTDPPDGA